MVIHSGCWNIVYSQQTNCRAVSWASHESISTLGKPTLGNTSQEKKTFLSGIAQTMLKEMHYLLMRASLIF